ncbi:MaoC/PaaZ C-terminal domain-containing protein [Rhodococcus qingshengii]|uniref:MaoC/PaaZ C-terminal domain-containing protein n=1 Tax=Rhodococcus qingshengii TaxID=334542 RepID=UPI0001A216E5|nr:MaoC/PaaZ C-terminal domain-containing protein [Rhodococcus qingshengii]EEN84933.1 MaoC-like protein [Rhodococcus erythropolis SK121]
MINTVSVPTPWVVGPVSRTDFVRYQGASGDMNPIHHDQVFAEAAGYPSPFSVGMFQAGLLATFATDWLGAENIRAIRVRFLEQVWPDDTLTCSALVERTYADDEGDKIDVELACTRQTGGLAVKAWATFVRPPLVPSERP